MESLKIGDGAVQEPQDSLLAEILVQAGRLTSQELTSIVALQGREKILFDRAAVASGILSEEDINWALAALKASERDVAKIEGDSIGHILIEAGRLTPQQVDTIMALKSRERLLFGEAAVASGILTEDDVRWALACQYAFPCAGGEAQAVSNELLVLKEPFCPCVESFRSIRSSLIFSGVGSLTTSISVVSAGEGEGKTFVAANLALVFAQLGTKTLLLDFNFRSPRIHSLFQVKNNRGATSLIIRRALMENAVQKAFLGTLDILPSGPTPPNPLELLSRGETNQLLKALKGRYGVVIVDTPAFLKNSDAQVISGLCDATLLIARKNFTKSASFGLVKRRLETSGAKIVGSVLNEISLRR